MILPTSALRKALLFVNTNFAAILAIYCIDLLQDNYLQPFMGAFSLLVYIPLLIFVFSGIYGAFIDLVSGKEIVLKMERVRYYAKKYWWMYTLIMALPHLATFLLSFFTLNGKFYPLDIAPFHSRILLFYLFSYFIIRNEYFKKFNLKLDWNVISLKAIIGLLFLELLSLGVFYYSWFFNIDQFHLVNILGFVEVYLNLLEYVYIVVLILEPFKEIPKAYDHDKELFMINPINGGSLTSLAFFFFRSYPPVFVVLKALTPKNYKFREFNRMFWHDHYFRSNKLVAITCYTSNCLEAYRMAKEFKARGSKVVMGGPHVTYMPKEALKYCDSVVIGECEGVWKDLIQDYESGTLKPTYKGGSIDNYYDEVHQELMQSPPYVIRDFLETTRGCKFKCHFCTIPGLSGGKVRRKPIFQLVELLKKVSKKYKTVAFIDNNIYNDPAYARELFKAIKPLKINWKTQCTIDIAKNTETLRLASESGCKEFLFGFEVGGGSLEKNKGGKFAMADQYLKYARIIKKAGIDIKAHFIFGFETDNFRNVFNMWKFCFLLNPLYTIFSVLTPLPGTENYHKTLRENRVNNLNWKYYDAQNLVFRHQTMNTTLLAMGYQFIRFFFMITTSKFGRIVLILTLFSFFPIDVKNLFHTIIGFEAVK